MKKQIITALMLMCTLTYAQVTVDWFNYPGGVGIATDSANNVYTANWDYNPAGDITLTKRNSAGTILWNATYDNTDNTRHEVATWVETDHAGNIIVSGTIRSGYSNPVNAASVLMKYNSGGTLLWRVVYESSFDGSSTKKCLVDANNNIYVLGIGTGPNGQIAKVKKFNSSGASVWNYFDSGIGAPVNFKLTPDYKIVISHRGITGSINGYSKIDLNGNNIWSLGGINSLTVGDAAGDAFGNTYIINGEYVVTNSGSILKKLAPGGAVLWTDTNSITGFRVEVGSDNNPVISGFPTSGGGGAAFMKFDLNGNMLWQNFDADSAYIFLSHAQMKMDQYNNSYLAAAIFGQMAVCKVNSNGTRDWVKTFSSGYSQAMSIGGDYNVYVTGGTTARISQPTPISPCVAPANLSVTNKTATSAKLNWSAVSNIVRYQVYYKKSTEATWTKLNVGKAKISLTLNNLVCNTNYKWKIRTVCDTVGVDIVSSFSPVVNFSTSACRYSSLSMEENNGVEVYPNPFSDKISIQLQNADVPVTVLIYDVIGKLQYTDQLTDLQNELNLSSLNSGIYFMNLMKEGRLTDAVRIVKK